MNIKRILRNFAIGSAIVLVLPISNRLTSAQIAVHHPYPGVGKTIQVNFGVAAFLLNFADSQHMSFIGVSGESSSAGDSV